jgi:hypothetical protein
LINEVVQIFDLINEVVQIFDLINRVVQNCYDKTKLFVGRATLLLIGTIYDGANPIYQPGGYWFPS